MKRSYYFFSGFFLTAVFAVGIIGFNMVAASSDNYLSGIMPKIVRTLENEEHFNIYFFNSGISMDKEAVNELAKAIQENHTIFIPAPLRLILQGNSFIKNFEYEENGTPERDWMNEKTEI